MRLEERNELGREKQFEGISLWDATLRDELAE
jgi:hypothetical protein